MRTNMFVFFMINFIQLRLIFKLIFCRCVIAEGRTGMGGRNIQRKFSEKKPHTSLKLIRNLLYDRIQGDPSKHYNEKPFCLSGYGLVNAADFFMNFGELSCHFKKSVIHSGFQYAHIFSHTRYCDFQAMGKSVFENFKEMNFLFAFLLLQKFDQRIRCFFSEFVA